MTLKIVHTKDGRTLYKDLDTGHWVPKDKATAFLEQQKREEHNRAVKQDEDLRDEQIRKQQREAERLNNSQSFNYSGFEHKYTTISASNGMPFTEWYDPKSGWTVAHKVHQPGYAPGYATWLIRDENGKIVEQIRSSMKDIDSSQAWQESIFEKAADYVKRRKNPEPYKDILGPKKDVDPIEVLTRCKEEKAINPHYNDEKEPQYKYHNNCAICTTAAVLQARGYDVEAEARDKDQWRGVTTVFDIDWKNKDNYIVGDSDHHTSDMPVVTNYDGARVLSYKDSKNSVQRVVNPPTMPKGSKAASKAIVDKVTSWGNGAVGELSVSWSGKTSWHSVLIVNQDADKPHGAVFIYDAQSNKVIPDIEKYLKRTYATRTCLIRLDNAPLKKDVQNELKKMVKRRDVK